VRQAIVEVGDKRRSSYGGGAVPFFLSRPRHEDICYRRLPRLSFITRISTPTSHLALDGGGPRTPKSAW
jgi:hypothetical protein